MNCEYQIKGNTLRIYIPKELDHHISDSLREEADLLTEAFYPEYYLRFFPYRMDGQFRHRRHLRTVQKYEILRRNRSGRTFKRTNV